MRRIMMLLTAFTVGSSLAAPLPPTLNGSWQVTHVGIDEWIQSSHYGVPDDPYLVGRRVVISQTEISTPMSNLSTCKAPEVSSGPNLSLDELVALTEGDRQTEPVKPVAKDYGLAFPGIQRVMPLMLNCKQGSFADEGANIKPWLVLADQNTLLVSGNMSSILTLKRVTDDLPLPAFDCRKAQQEDEQAICRSYDLAAWDKSVKEAYSAAIQQLKQNDNKHELKQVISAQRLWIKERAACRTNSQCLYKSMSDRINFLSQYY